MMRTTPRLTQPTWGENANKPPASQPQQSLTLDPDKDVSSPSSSTCPLRRPTIKKVSVPENLRNGLVSVSSDKAAVAMLQNALSELTQEQKQEKKDPKSLSGAEVFSSLSAKGGLGHIDLGADHVKKLFQGGTPFLARTLTKGSNNPVVSNVPTTLTSAKVERNTLNNRLRGRNIVLTPSTMLEKDIKVSTISSHPARPKWSKMPSVLYTAPTENAPKSVGDRVTFRPSFGNVLSFASNAGFTPDFLEKMNSGDHSHAELIEQFRAQPKISSNLKADAPFNTLPRSLSDLKKQVAAYRENQTTLQRAGKETSLYPDGSVPHNEVISRLWIWDAVAVDVGQEMKAGLSTSIELQVARQALHTELEQQGTEHPMFRDFVTQQLSISDDKKPLTRTESLSRYNALTPNNRSGILEELKTRLQSPISLCRYSPQDPSINSISEDEVSGEDVLEAINSVLSARLGKPV